METICIKSENLFLTKLRKNVLIYHLLKILQFYSSFIFSKKQKNKKKKKQTKKKQQQQNKTKQNKNKTKQNTQTKKDNTNKHKIKQTLKHISVCCM